MVPRMDELVWETPPTEAIERAAGRGGHYLDVALALRERPGQWARIPREYATVDSARNTAQNMRRGHVKGFTKGDYELVPGEHGGKPAIWARYIKAVDAPAPETNGDKPSTEEEDGDDDPVSKEYLAAIKAYNPKVREWARGQGLEVPERGRLPQALRERYHQETGEPVPPALRSV